jgi:hypothetical protein
MTTTTNLNPASAKPATPSAPSRSNPTPSLSNPAGAPAAGPGTKLPEYKPPEFRMPPSPVLRFSPTAWAKLQYFCHHGDTEIGGFGITSAGDLLQIEDFETVHQIVSSVSVAFDDTAVADFFEDQVDEGKKPEQFARIWCHTHPGSSPNPSLTDEETFDRVFHGCDWAIMFILARAGKTYCRLRFNVGPGASMLIPVEVDYRSEFGASDHASWRDEYDFNIHAEPLGFELPKTESTFGHSPPSLGELLADVHDDRELWQSWEEYVDANTEY